MVLKKKEYPQKPVERVMKRVKFSIQKVVQSKADKKVVPVIVTYPLLKSFIKIVHYSLSFTYVRRTSWHFNTKSHGFRRS